jgi:hypothetical protein
MKELLLTCSSEDFRKWYSPSSEEQRVKEEDRCNELRFSRYERRKQADASPYLPNPKTLEVYR